MTAKYPGTCFECGERIKAGDTIRYYGRHHVEHAQCTDGGTAERKPIGPCWICQSPEGYFRARGAATPVWCDVCNDDQSKGDLKLGTVTILNHDRQLARSGLSVTRFSSGEVMTRNSRGRCEDAPCCGCCS